MSVSEMNSAQYFEQIVTEAKISLKMKQTPLNQADFNDAILLQDFLNYMLFRKSSKNVYDEMFSVLIEENSGMKPFLDSIRRNFKVTSTDIKTNVELEETIRQLIDNTMQAGVKEGHFKTNPVKQGSVLGTDTMDFFQGVVDEHVKENMIIAYLSAKEGFKEHYDRGSSEMKKYARILLQQQGKIDVSEQYTFETSTELNPIMAKIYNLLTQSFSIKGYEKGGSIELGNTNVFRVYLSMNTLTNDIDTKINRWHRMMNCHKYHDSHQKDIYRSVYQMRIMYELTGYGIQYLDPNIPQNEFNKFLIFYNGAINKIIVYPTALYLQSLFNAVFFDKTLDDLTYEKAFYGSIILRRRGFNIEKYAGFRS